MAWCESMLRSFGPGLMGGLTFGKWVQLLRENHFAVTPSCLPRAIAISFQSLQNTLFHWTDQRRLGGEEKQVRSSTLVAQGGCIGFIVLESPTLGERCEAVRYRRE